ncbi:homoserine dehydrogenase [Variovorax paradoxus]|uniref:Homoserine dehydrogenase n=1 Tax=Variovorax paradoxus TaxID=34073 RepID=A0A0D0M534_VARPD|nr:homoserine dehydrogenase [Variovorax paradoxus]KIQ25734.1 homoserine dehydrogenase [Variovorax paradoxus]
MYRDPVLSLQPLAGVPVAMRPLRVGMIGIGTVGSGTFRVLARNQAEIAGRAGRGIEVVMVAARNLPRAAGIVGEGVPLTDDPMHVATHPDIDVLVEVAGGTGPARDWVLAAIAHGKHVVTANKALLAEHGAEIFTAARQHGVAVAYEGAVAVSIPIVKALREGLTANRIEWVAGIINGTTNFILSKMRDEGLDFAAALAEAQALGYAEADPAFDIEGIDAAHKLTLLAANAFGTPVRFADVQVEGITTLQGADVACAEQLGFRIKLLGIARRREEGVELRVQPALVPATHLMAHVNGSMNAVMVKGDASGVTMYYGAGAGSEQTASAVIADLVDVARLDGTHAAQRVPHLGFHAHAMSDLKALPRAAVCTSHYLRVPVHSAGQIEAVAALLAGHRVPVQQMVLAAERPEAGPQVLVLTEPAPQAAIDLAVHALQASAAVAGAVTTLRVEALAG